MQNIFNDDFLLHSEQARRLYHDYARNLPIIDFHNHLSPQEIAADKNFENITAIWLHGDHYKWRAMRAWGIDEQYITGNASDEEKFLHWAKVVPHTVKNPLFHWTHMELRHPFGVHEWLNEKTANGIYHHCNELLQQKDFSTRSLLQRFGAEMLGTTDDPCDSLDAHRQLKEEGFPIRVLPSFRPDKALQIGNRPAFMHYIQRLSKTAGHPITDLESLLHALQLRVDYFHEHGCRVADHGLSQMLPAICLSKQLQDEFSNFLTDESASYSQPLQFAGHVLAELCRTYHAKGWVQQFHVGALRNNNSRMLATIGPDTGYDSIGDYSHGESMAAFLNELDRTDQLAKTIIYNLNPADNEMFAAMTGNFNSGGIRGKVQYGPAWWFLDQKDGIKKQINALANMSLLSTFVGMTTDSRSFLSYSRHDYFRRILCNQLGSDMQKGEIPNDYEWIGQIVRDICYSNAAAFFVSRQS